MKKDKIDQIRTLILTKKNPYKYILFNPENNEYIIREKNGLPRQSNQIEVFAVLSKFPEMKVEILTIDHEQWNTERKVFERVMEPVLPEFLKNRPEYYTYTDFGNAQLLQQYIDRTTNDLIEIKSPVSGIDFDNKIHCTVPGVYRIEMNSKETN